MDIVFIRNINYRGKKECEIIKDKVIHLNLSGHETSASPPTPQPDTKMDFTYPFSIYSTLHQYVYSSTQDLNQRYEVNKAISAVFVKIEFL